MEVPLPSLQPFTGMPIPSLSPLMGTIRPATAAAAIETQWQLSRRKGRRRSKPYPSAQVTSLTQAAHQHVSSISKLPRSPYVPTQAHSHRAGRLQQAISQLLQAVADQQPQTGQQQDSQPHDGIHLDSGALRDNTQQKPLTPQQAHKQWKAAVSSRPSTSMSVQDFTLPRPASSAGRVRGGALTSSWSGPLLSHCQGTDKDVPSSSSTPCTPQRRLPSKGSRLRASAPAPLMGMLLGLPKLQPAHAEVWVNPSALQASQSEGDSTKDRLLLGSVMGNQAAADGTGSTAAAASAAAATARLLVNRAGLAGEVTGHWQMPDVGMHPSTSSCAEPAGARQSHMSSNRSQQWEQFKAHTFERPLGAPGNPRWGPGQPLQHFLPSRGMMYSVFAELDPSDTGKLTYSNFEEACVACGLRQEQAARLYSVLDSDSKGYFTMREWGAKEHERQVLDFTRLYVHATRGSSGKPMGIREVKSAKLAVQIALHKLQVKHHGRVVNPEQLLRAFDFIDVDRSGSLSLTELQDAFNAMGIYVVPDVLLEVMDKFDTNGNGLIEYREFIQVLFPILSKSL